MKATQDYFDEKILMKECWRLKKKYTSMVILGYVNKDTGKIKSVAPLPTALSLIIFIMGLIFLLLPSIAIAAYYLIKAGGRVREFKTRLEAEKL